METETPPRRSNRLFIFVTLIFLILIAAWTFLIVTAVENQPEVIEVEE